MSYILSTTPVMPQRDPPLVVERKTLQLEHHSCILLMACLGSHTISPIGAQCTYYDPWYPDKWTTACTFMTRKFVTTHSPILFAPLWIQHGLIFKPIERCCLSLVVHKMSRSKRNCQHLKYSILVGMFLRLILYPPWGRQFCWSGLGCMPLDTTTFGRVALKSWIVEITMHFWEFRSLIFWKCNNDILNMRSLFWEPLWCLFHCCVAMNFWHFTFTLCFAASSLLLWHYCKGSTFSKTCIAFC